MKDYLLFVDTETSGIPRDWSQPYASRGSWPHIVQLAWVVCTADGQQVKVENHYIRPSDYDLDEAAGKIHGLTPEFLRQHGRSRHAVMLRLHRDLLHYQPRVVAHFMQLDFHMMGVGFYRAGLPNPLPELPQFCTMRATGPFLRHATQGFLRLGELHQRLFREPLLSEHDALVDARATARCFFAMREQGLITDDMLAHQTPVALPAAAPPARAGWRVGVAPWLLLATLALLLLAFLLIS